jgi:hypothetical protein
LIRVLQNRSEDVSVEVEAVEVGVEVDVEEVEVEDEGGFSSSFDFSRRLVV